MSIASANNPPGMMPPRVIITIAVYSRLNCGMRWSIRRATSSHVIISRRRCGFGCMGIRIDYLSIFEEGNFITPVQLQAELVRAHELVGQQPGLSLRHAPRCINTYDRQ